MENLILSETNFWLSADSGWKTTVTSAPCSQSLSISLPLHLSLSFQKKEIQPSDLAIQWQLLHHHQLHKNSCYK